MICLIDNYDSFTYNLYQLFGTLGEEPVKVLKNDQVDVAKLTELAPDKLIFSPGPGRPENAGNMMKILEYFAGKVPILGVCLGEQAIGELYGAKVVHAEKLMHGRPSDIDVNANDPLFHRCPNHFLAARYHSLIVDKNTTPSELTISAQTSEHEIMAVSDVKNKIFGVQFHPESIMTNASAGKQIALNFMNLN